MKRMTQTNPPKLIRVPADVHAELKQYCQTEGRIMEWAVKEAVKCYLALSSKEREALQAHYASLGYGTPEHLSVDNPFTEVPF